MSMTTLGIDLAKTVFHVQGRDVAGRPVFQKRFSRAALVKFMANLPSCRVGLEVCSGANHWSRTSQAFGHDVALPEIKTAPNSDTSNSVGIGSTLSGAIISCGRPNSNNIANMTR